MRTLRVFPRRTNATPTDLLSVIGRAPDLFDEADQVHVSIAFDWDLEYGYRLAEAWRCVGDVQVGGPATGMPGDEFTPGQYLKEGNVITSRGCPNNCWFCRVPELEGTKMRELQIKDGWNVYDSNLLACSREHQEAVFSMLQRQDHLIRFSGGLEARRFTDWHADWMVRLLPEVMWFAYDTKDDYEPLVSAAGLLREAGLIGGKHRACCYVLVGWKGDTFESAEIRIRDVVELGYFPQAMLFNRGLEYEEPDRTSWRQFARSWANKIIVGSRIRGD